MTDRDQRPPRPPPRTSTDSATGGPAPLRQVVGFHVEGVAASPSPAGLLSSDAAAAAGGARVSSSPNVVLIPPTFQAQQV